MLDEWKISRSTLEETVTTSSHLTSGSMSRAERILIAATVTAQLLVDTDDCGGSLDVETPSIDTLDTQPR
jgi:hypothetical protein